MVKKSFVGTYTGYTDVEANGYVRTSEYVTVSDGTRIAVDILHPAADGTPLSGPRPTIVRGTGYRRAFVKGDASFYDVRRLEILEKYPVGALITPYELAPNAKLLVDHGYNFVSIDFRGTGASFGQNTNYELGSDIAEIIDWIALQPWSNGKIGMWGRSWEAMVQLFTAAAKPTHLTCLAPAALGTERNGIWYNGVYFEGFTRGWSLVREGQDNAEPAAPVDGPDGERLRDEARAQAVARYANASVSEKMSEVLSEFCDVAAENSAKIMKNPANATPIMQRIDQLNACGAATYIFGGWWDMAFVNDQISLYRSLTVPKKILTGPWTHSQFEFGYEFLRWFDHWLKEIDNGIMDELPMHYCTSDFHGGKKWYGARDWPLTQTRALALYATEVGVLTEKIPERSDLSHTVDHGINNGRATRTQYMFNAMRLSYPRLNERAARCLSFETAPLERPVEITGVPSVHVNLSCDKEDLSLMVTLEQIDDDGNAYYLSEGVLNLKHRQVSTPDSVHIEPHWHSENKTESLPVIPGEPMQIDLDMFAVSARLEKGHRIRIALAFADTENYAMPTYDPPANVKVAIGGDSGLRVILPATDPETKPGCVAEAFQSDTPDYAFELTQ